MPMDVVTGPTVVLVLQDEAPGPPAEQPLLELKPAPTKLRHKKSKVVFKFS